MPIALLTTTSHLSHSHLLLPPHLYYLPVGIRMQITTKSWATSRTVFRHKPTRLKPNPTCITKCFWPKGTCPPLWSFFSSTVLTFPPNWWDFHPFFCLGNFITWLSPPNLLTRVFVSNARATPTAPLATSTDWNLKVITAV